MRDQVNELNIRCRQLPLEERERLVGGLLEFLNHCGYIPRRLRRFWFQNCG